MVLAESINFVLTDGMVQSLVTGIVLIAVMWFGLQALRILKKDRQS